MPSKKVYEVEKIISKKMINGKVNHLVKWAGFKSSDNTWESEERLAGCETAMEVFKEAESKREKRSQEGRQETSQKTPISSRKLKRTNLAIVEHQQQQEEPEYDVEKIINEKMINGKLHYLVKWVGFPSSKNTWEPEEGLLDCDIAMEQFKRAGAKRNMLQDDGQTVSKKKPAASGGSESSDFVLAVHQSQPKNMHLNRSKHEPMVSTSLSSTTSSESPTPEQIDANEANRKWQNAVRVREVSTLTKGGGLFFMIQNDGHDVTWEKNADVRQFIPQLLIDYYEASVQLEA